MSSRDPVADWGHAEEAAARRARLLRVAILTSLVLAVLILLAFIARSFGLFRAAGASI